MQTLRVETNVNLISIQHAQTNESPKMTQTTTLKTLIKCIART